MAGELQMWLTFAVIATAIILYIVEWVELEVTALATVAALLLIFQLFPLPDAEGENLLGPAALLAGFASPALFTVLALLVVGQGLFHTGALDQPVRALARGRAAPGVVLTGLLLVTAAVSAFANNTPVVVMFLPVATALAARMRHSPSKTLMALSFASILGGMTTLIGSSTNILVADVARVAGMTPLGFFDFTVPGLILAVVGMAYVLLVMPLLLPERAGMAEAITGSGRQFVAQVKIREGHPWDGEKAVAGMFPALRNMTVRLIQRGPRPILPPFDDITLEPGDLVILAATRKSLTEALQTHGADVSTDDSDIVAAQSLENAQTAGNTMMLAEAVITPGSRMIGRPLRALNLRDDLGLVVLGLQRRNRMVRSRLAEVRLEAGDVLLVLGLREQVERLRGNRDLLLMEATRTELPLSRKAVPAFITFAAVIAIAATGLLPIVVAAILGALAMIVSGCLNLWQASRALDRRIYLLIGSSIAMAVPLEVTGGAAFIADLVVELFEGASPHVVLSAFFLVIAVLTNFLSNNATAVLFTPIALETAERVGVTPLAFVVAVIFAANCSFATPMGYQTNLLVMGPGHYRFRDFVVAGTPLAILVWLTYSLVGPWYFGVATGSP